MDFMSENNMCVIWMRFEKNKLAFALLLLLLGTCLSISATVRSLGRGGDSGEIL